MSIFNWHYQSSPHTVKSYILSVCLEWLVSIAPGSSVGSRKSVYVFIRIGFLSVFLLVFQISQNPPPRGSAYFLARMTRLKHSPSLGVDPPGIFGSEGEGKVFLIGLSSVCLRSLLFAKPLFAYLFHTLCSALWRMQRQSVIHFVLKELSVL